MTLRLLLIVSMDQIKWCRRCVSVDVFIVGRVSGLGWGYCIALRVGWRRLRQTAGEQEGSRCKSDNVFFFLLNPTEFELFPGQQETRVICDRRRRPTTSTIWRHIHSCTELTVLEAGVWLKWDQRASLFTCTVKHYCFTFEKGSFKNG